MEEGSNIVVRRLFRNRVAFKEAALVDVLAAFLPGRPVWPHTQQKVTDRHPCHFDVGCLKQNLDDDWSGIYPLRLCKILGVPCREVYTE
jgi:hypothetical protein